nr:hypothetical protein [Pseudomonas syringae]
MNAGLPAPVPKAYEVVSAVDPFPGARDDDHCQQGNPWLGSSHQDNHCQVNGHADVDVQRVSGQAGG